MNAIVGVTLCYFVVCAVGVFVYGKKFLALKLWVKAAIVVPLMVGMFYAVWWMHNEAEKAEPVWHVQAKHWDHTPIAVYWDESSWESYTESFSKAVELWNDAVGCTLFVVQEEPDVWIVSADGTPCGSMAAQPLEATDAAGAYLCSDGTAQIQIAAPGDTREALEIVMHELGHVVGLAHDPTGLMNIQRRGMKLVRPSDKDARALASRYCN